MTRIVIIGAGGHGRDVLDVLYDYQDQEAVAGHKVEFVGFLDDGNPTPEHIALLGEPFLGPLSVLPDLGDVQYVIAIGSGQARRDIDQYATGLGLDAAVLIHSAATVGHNTRVSPGVILCAGARATTNVTLGRHVHLNLNATAAHDAVLEDYATLNPGACVSGNVTIGEAAMIGTGAVVNQGVTIGPDTRIGSGAAVVGDVPGGVTAVGVPARPV